MKKRILALLLLGCLAFAVVSCEDPDNNTNKESESQQNEAEQSGSNNETSDGTSETKGSGMQVGVDTSSGWGPLNPVN